MDRLPCGLIPKNSQLPVRRKLDFNNLQAPSHPGESQKKYPRLMMQDNLAKDISAIHEMESSLSLTHPVLALGLKPAGGAPEPFKSQQTGVTQGHDDALPRNVMESQKNGSRDHGMKLEEIPIADVQSQPHGRPAIRRKQISPTLSVKQAFKAIHKENLVELYRKIHLNTMRDRKSKLIRKGRAIPSLKPLGAISETRMHCPTRLFVTPDDLWSNDDSDGGDKQSSTSPASAFLESSSDEDTNIMDCIASSKDGLTISERNGNDTATVAGAASTPGVESGTADTEASEDEETHFAPENEKLIVRIRKGNEKNENDWVVDYSTVEVQAEDGDNNVSACESENESSGKNGKSESDFESHGPSTEESEFSEAYDSDISEDKYDEGETIANLFSE